MTAMICACWRDGTQAGASFPAREFRKLSDLSGAGLYLCRRDQLQRAGAARQQPGAASIWRAAWARRAPTSICVAFRRPLAVPAHAILLFDLCRGASSWSMLWNARSRFWPSRFDQEDTAVPTPPRDGEGYGLVEAPRGPLIHHYRIENGLIAEARVRHPHRAQRPGHRAGAACRRRALHHRRQQINLELERAVGRVVRAFDPCIACATH